jgi:electron transport complex protein RnfC
MKVYSFARGGISFEDPTAPSRSAVDTAFLPALSVIPLIQHPYGRSYPVVSIGDTVREGMLIGRAQGRSSANVHATVPGKVVKMVSWKMAGGQMNEGLVIRLEGSFRKLGKQEDTFPWEEMLPSELQQNIAEFGVIEMEGEGRPVSDIINSIWETPEPITLVVRCVFDDPWMAADYVLCKERMKAVVEGSRIIARIIRAVRIIYAVSHREKALGERFIAEAGKWDPPSIHVPVGSKFPQKNRRELLFSLRNYGKKEGIELGSIMILGPVTLAAVFDAVRLRKPAMDRYIAVGGSAVKNPQVMKVRIGTRLCEIFAQCGGFTKNPKRIATGSPLLGRAVIDLDEPITKTSFGLFAFSDGPKAGMESGICISCGECRDVCPIGLDPEEIYKQRWIGEKLGEDPSQQEEAHPFGASTGNSECHGCRCCDVVCPSRLPLSSSVSTPTANGSFLFRSIGGSDGGKFESRI